MLAPIKINYTERDREDGEKRETTSKIVIKTRKKQQTSILDEKR
jgi:hypothetical protein